MKSLGLIAIAASLFVVFAAQAGDDAAVKKEKAAFQGVWKITKFETAKGADDNIPGATLEFDKDGKNLTFSHNGETKKGVFKLNPAGKPKEIDVSPGNEDKTIEGIYELDKTMLKLCLTMNPGDGRPSEFEAKEGKSFVVVTLEKQK